MPLWCPRWQNLGGDLIWSVIHQYRNAPEEQSRCVLLKRIFWHICIISIGVSVAPTPGQGVQELPGIPLRWDVLQMKNSHLPKRSKCFILIWTVVWMGFLLEHITRQQIRDNLDMREFLTIKKTIEFFFLIYALWNLIFNSLVWTFLPDSFIFLPWLWLLAIYSTNKLAFLFQKL